MRKYCFFFFPSFQLLLPISVYVHFPWLFRPLFAASASVCFEIFSRFALPFYFISSLCFSPLIFLNKPMISCVI